MIADMAGSEREEGRTAPTGAPPPPRRRRYWLIPRAAAAAAVLMAIGCAQVARTPPPGSVSASSVAGREVPLGSSGITIVMGDLNDATHGTGAGVPYGRFFFLRSENTVVAIRFQAGRAEPASYEWECRTDGRLSFSAPGVTRGAGEAHEVTGKGLVTAGPLKLEWSRGDQDRGYVYWPDEVYWPDQPPPALQICSEMFGDPAALTQGSTVKWYSIKERFP